MVGKRITSIIVIMLILSLFTNAFFMTSIIEITKIASANPGDVNETWHNTSTLTVTVITGTPIINWYDFSLVSGHVSKLNQQVDVEAEYEFRINITQSNGWVAVDYINITAWYDNGSDATTYNQSAGGNLNMFLQYENTTGNANYTMLWPDTEVTKGSIIETVISSTCHNISLQFTPHKQIRYAPGDGSWSTAANTTDDPWSWNFIINVSTSGGTSATKTDEYGIYRYVAIDSAGNPSMSGAPGENAEASSITVRTVSNTNYSLSVNLNATLDGPGAATIAKSAVGVDGGEKAAADNVWPAYLYGGAASYTDADDDDTYKDTTDVVFNCTIPNTVAGDYTSLVYYNLKGE
ncbi:hypothetical protein MBGDN05_00702 [Thermoplasmatales archaeon SCGC AB-539-N05]|nr:hypothetical protein MBGDN05_00702 [Thermoplasmatales archaeon SCGC AB-539-N05]